MPSFAIKYPFFVLMLCLAIVVVGVTTVARMPVDLFPPIDIPVVVVATFYGGMPPQQVEANITDTFERFFTLGSNIDHIESRSLTGVSLIKVYFEPGTDADAAASEIANLAMADLRRLPQGTLPPVVLKFDASSLPVCLVTLKGKGLNETDLHDQGQFNVRNQIANVPGASVPQPYGGKYRQIQFYVDPVKLEAAQMSPMDVVNVINDSNKILPAGDVRIGPKDYNIYSNSQLPDVSQMNDVPLKAIGNGVLRFGDIGHAEDSSAIQYNIVRVDGQKSVYLPILKQGGNSNTIQIVDGVRDRVKHLLDIPSSLVANVVFDQSQYVKIAVANVLREGGIGLVLTAVMILIFLGSVRGTISVLISIPVSCLAAFLLLNGFGGTINTMVLGGLALVLSRLIDNSVVVLENIFRHMEEGEDAVTAAERGGQEVQLAVLAATFTTAIVFFPVIFLYGVSKYLFTALALGVVLALAASYLVAMTVVPLFCAKFIKTAHGHGGHQETRSIFGKFVAGFNHRYNRMLGRYDAAVAKALNRPVATVVLIMGSFVVSLALAPLLGVAFFPRTDPGQFVINVKAPTGSRLEMTNQYIARVEDDIRGVIGKDDLQMIVSNIGMTPDLSAIYTSNSAQHTAFVQVSLNKEHKVSTFTYMDRVRRKLDSDLPELSTYFQTGGLVDSVVNMGMPAPIDIQVSGNNQHAAYAIASEMAAKVRQLKDVSDVLIPQDLDYPGIELNVRREMAARLGLTATDVVDNVVTALTSNGMIAPSYWVDPHSGNNYFLTVQYNTHQLDSMTMEDFKQIPLHAKDNSSTTMLENVADIKMINTPTEVDHYQLFRKIDVYVSPKGEDLGSLAGRVQKIIDDTKLPANIRVEMRGSVKAMHQSFLSFGVGLLLAIVLVYLILMAQFASFLDPFIILLAIPSGITGVILFLLLTGTTLNVMSLMGVLMMTGIVVSNSILIVDVTRKYREAGMPIREAVALACRVRLRPILMTSLATLLGLVPMALALEAGSEQYAPLARSIIGGLLVSVVLTVFIVPAAYLLIHRREEAQPPQEVQA
ncbi:MAG TPA: efflux RND transporter permease subunit [Candidatus Limnocylindrales bacterium]|nr:efflux RND transporter permease subunit [Candidatus Limnocylindrales bacterium]